MPGPKKNNKTDFVGIAGNIGAGKTTLTTLIAERFNWKPYYETVMDNPYLSDFYDDMHRWSFNLQVFFLSNRFKTHKEIEDSGRSCVQDRTIYEDVEIFARNLHEMGNMSDRDYGNYRELFSIITSYLKKPDLIIYLKATTDTLLSRIRSRGRDFEKGIKPEYLHMLNIAYDHWIKKAQKDINVYIIESDNINILEDKKELQIILDTIRKYCPE